MKVGVIPIGGLNIVISPKPALYFNAITLLIKIKQRA